MIGKKSVLQKITGKNSEKDTAYLSSHTVITEHSTKILKQKNRKCRYSCFFVLSSAYNAHGVCYTKPIMAKITSNTPKM